MENEPPVKIERPVKIEPPVKNESFQECFDENYRRFVAKQQCLLSPIIAFIPSVHNSNKPRTSFFICQVILVSDKQPGFRVTIFRSRFTDRNTSIQMWFVN